SKFNGLANMDPNDVICQQRSNASLTFPPGIQKLQASISENKGREVRRLNLVLTAGGPVQLRFDPARGDDRALKAKLTLGSGKTNTLAVFAPGGTLSLTRPNINALTTIEIR